MTDDIFGSMNIDWQGAYYGLVDEFRLLEAALFDRLEQNQALRDRITDLEAHRDAADYANELRERVRELEDERDRALDQAALLWDQRDDARRRLDKIRDASDRFWFDVTEHVDALDGPGVLR